MTHNLLLIDDDQDAILSLARALETHSLNASIHAATNHDIALKIAKEKSPEAIVLDLCLDSAKGVDSGFKLLSALLKTDPSCRILVLTGHNSTENGIKSIQLGAANYLTKPANIDHLSALLQDAIYQTRLRRELLHLQTKQSSASTTRLIGLSTTIKALKEQINYAAANDQSILISGETGTGKGVCAALIHQLSARSKSRLVRYQPNFTASEMINSDLFGHKKGAFTGADSSRQGLLIEADGGTLFLDEVDELPKESQIALLGALQDKHFRPLGENREASSNFRLISACNKPIQESLDNGLLRPDFYHRIAHYTINIPPLRERKEDIPILAQAFLATLSEKDQLSVFEISQTALVMLTDYSWPGNVRELKAKIESAAFQASFHSRTIIEDKDLALSTPGFNQRGQLTFNEEIKNFKKQIVLKALDKTSGNQVKAAKDLEIDRSTLRRILES